MSYEPAFGLELDWSSISINCQLSDNNNNMMMMILEPHPSNAFCIEGVWLYDAKKEGEGVQDLISLIFFQK